MTYLIAAAGTGGHVFPGLAVGEALLDLGAPREEILFSGGDRLESKVYPEEGFPFLELEIRGLQRSLSVDNLRLPALVIRAKNRVLEAIGEHRVRVALGMGGYVTIPAGLAARSAGIPFFNAEQNAEAGLANRIAARWARRSFVSFPETGGLPDAEWVGNPVREPFWSFDREALREKAARRYQLRADEPVLGVFGGSLGAAAINEGVARMVQTWDGPPIQVLHLTGERHLEAMSGLRAAENVVWKRVGFEDSMEAFYSVCDLVIARAGGAVAEITATATPSILVPGQFGSTGHQKGNARFLSDAGAAITITQDELGDLGAAVRGTLFDEVALEKMRGSARRIARPDAARTIARVMLEAAR